MAQYLGKVIELVDPFGTTSTDKLCRLQAELLLVRQDDQALIELGNADDESEIHIFRKLCLQQTQQQADFNKNPSFCRWAMVQQGSIEQNRKDNSRSTNETLNFV